MRKFSCFLLCVISLGCENSRIPFEYIDTQMNKLNDIGIRERSIQLPISGSIEIMLFDHNLLKGIEEEVNIDTALMITADFTFMKLRNFTISFSNESGERLFTVNTTDSAMTVKNNDGDSINIPVNVLWGTSDEDIENELSDEANQYLWGVKCVLTHLFPLTVGYKDPQDILLDRRKANSFSISPIGELEDEALLMTFVFDKFKRSYITEIFGIYPVLFVKSDDDYEDFQIITYLDYFIWDLEKNWIFPTIVTGVEYISTLKTISVAEMQ